MDSVVQILQRVPQPVQYALAGVGALFLSSKLLGLAQFVLNVFILGGTDVSTPSPSIRHSFHGNSIHADPSD